jgi:hypothetical protein
MWCFKGNEDAHPNLHEITEMEGNLVSTIRSDWEP